MALPNSLIPNSNVSVELIDVNLYKVLKKTIYPGASDESIEMVIAYCKARKLDVVRKPVHLVPMNVKTGKKDNNGKDIYEWRDVVMPGIGLYRIDADRTGQYAGMDEPIYGEDITEAVGSVKMTYPKWCKITVHKIIGDKIVKFTATEFWKENYGTKGRNDSSPKDIWEKRPYGQLAKCTEAQALRKAFPDAVGQEPTKEEMEGKHHPIVEERVEREKVVSATIIQPEVVIEPAPIMVDHDIEQDILDISWTQTVDQLQTYYTRSYKYWAAQRHKENLERLMKAKDKRKDEIEQEKGEVVNVETGEIK